MVLLWFMEMSNMTSESEERISCKNSPSFDEGSTESERNMVEGTGFGSLKKGPWTSAEDAILMEYVSQNGEGNWNAVQKLSGLSRCGKSCRLRWTNHLRPDLKKGAFTPEEERLIIELHAKMGNKWARMAVELPGRTDNEIKNFWNTRTKRKQRAGLPIYPHDISFQQLNDNSQNQNMLMFPNGDSGIFPPTTNLHIPSIDYKDFILNHEFYQNQIPTESSLLDIAFPMPTPYPPKRFRPGGGVGGGGGGGGGGLGDVFSGLNGYEDEKIGQTLTPSSSSYLYNTCTGSHAFINGNNCSSFEPNLWAMKNELPSLQYFHGAPPSSSSCSSFEIEWSESDSHSRRNSGLLEAVLHESETLKISKTKNDLNNVDDQNLVSDCYGSPLTYSAASVFSEYTPISGTSMDEHFSVEATSVKQEAGESDDIWNDVSCLRPDSLLGLNWFSSDPITSLVSHHDDTSTTIHTGSQYL